MRINPVPFLIARIRNIPNLGDVLVSSDMLAHRVGESAIVVTLEPGGKRVVRNRLDAFRIRISHYGASKKIASDQAFLVREYLLETLPDTDHDGIAVNEVEEDDSPFEFPDDDSGEQRYIHRITLYLYTS